MQDSWCQWANRALAGDGQTFERGRPKAETRAEHLSPEDYRRSLDIAAERERDGPCRQFVDRIAEMFGDDGDDDRYRRLALYGATVEQRRPPAIAATPIWKRWPTCSRRKPQADAGDKGMYLRTMSDGRQTENGMIV